MLVVQPHGTVNIMEHQTLFMETPMQTALPPCVVPVKEAARLLSLSLAKTYGLLASGELKSVKIGRSRRIPLSEIQRLSTPQTKE
jgi:excisionase family DNA binding protein